MTLFGYPKPQSANTPLVYNVTLNIPRYLNFKDNQHVTVKNSQFDFTETYYYLKDVTYRITLKQHGEGVYLSKEII